MKFILLLALILNTLLYFPINNRNVKKFFNFELPLDKKIPYLPIFSIFYVLAYFYWGGTVLFALINQPDSYFLKLIISLLITGISSYILYLIFPATISWPKLSNISISEKILKMIHGTVKATSLFPSLHIAYTLIYTFFLLSLFPNLLIPLSLLTILICVSTVFIKAHYLLDLIAGAFLAITVFYLVFSVWLI